MTPYVIRVFTAKPALDFFTPQGKLFITEAQIQWKGEEIVRPFLSFHSLCGQLKCRTQRSGPAFAWNKCEKRGKEHIKSFISSCLNSMGPVWKEGDSLFPEKAHHKFFPIWTKCSQYKGLHFSETVLWMCSLMWFSFLAAPYFSPCLNGII